MVDPDLVARLLGDSRAAHMRYRTFAPRMTAVPGSHPIPDLGSPYDADKSLLEARDYRQQAHDADPAHTVPAWANDIAPHDELMAYYSRVLDR
jgi:hypothetical protein